MSETNLRPPRLAEWILHFISKPEERFSVIGDFEEIYGEIAIESGITKAQYWYWFQIIKSAPLFLVNYIYWSVAMFKNYFKIALRNMQKQKLFSFINISGLAVGITCCIVILLWIKYELSYDRFHENSKEICSVLIQYDKGAYQTGLYGALPAALKEEIPEIINSARLSSLWPLNKNPIKYEENSFVLTGNAADPAFFDIFTYPFLKGDPKTALSEPNSIVLTEETAVKLFGDEDPLNKSVQFEIWGNLPYICFRLQKFIYIIMPAAERLPTFTFFPLSVY